MLLVLAAIFRPLAEPARLVLACLVLSFLSSGPAHGRQADLFVVRGAEVFDGHEVISGVDVLVRDGVIAEVGPDIPADGAEVVDGAGRTLMPGLIDAHVHVFGDALQATLRFGVTTALDMFTHPDLARALRGNVDPSLADLRSAGILATAPSGHGTQFGFEIPTLTDAEDAAGFVEDRIAEGSDYIKIVYDNGSGWSGDIPTISREILVALVQAAHAADRLAVVHVHDLHHAREALEAGADGLVHLFLDAVPDEAFLELAKQSGAFITPTFTILEAVCGRDGGPRLADDPDLAARLTPSDRTALRRPFPGSVNRPDYDIAKEAARLLHAAGVPLLAGSDAPNPGTTHGASLHRELELLVEAGLSPIEALRSATSLPAARFGLTDRGVIRAGMRADLLLVEGDPTTDVRATRRIVQVWKAGRVAVSRIADEGNGAGFRVGLVSDFETDLGALTGAGWAASTDVIAGGDSTASIERIEGGAGESAGALEVNGEVGDAFVYPWAGVMFHPGVAVMAPADLSLAKTLSFQARGDGGQYRVMLLRTGGGIPATLLFTAPPEWARVTLSLSDFRGADLTAVAGIVFSAGPSPGKFSFAIDDVTIE